MKKLIALTAVAMLSSTANAGQKCNGTVTLSSKPCQQQSHVTYITTARPVAAHPAATADIVDTAVGAGSFKTLVAAVQAAGLVDTLKGAGPFTVFAPTDEAFAKLPKGTVESLLRPENRAKLQSILTYHVVAGKVKAADVVKLTGAKTVQGQQVDIKVTNGKVTVDGANVVKTDIETSNGVIHVIDSVMLPADKDIVDTAVGAGSFKTLVAAVKAAGLVDTLKGEGPFTVFAPTDDAFAKLPEGTVANLLKPENKDQLAAILTYHVVAGKVLASDVVQISSAKTVNGKSASVKVTGAGVMIDGAKVIATDIETSNGVIHVIDSVILPGKLTAQAARRMIESAIADGSRRFNSHDHAGCAAIYTSTMQRIMADRPSSICDSEAHAVKMTMSSGLNTHCMTQRSWTMRQALESTYAALAQ